MSVRHGGHEKSLWSAAGPASVFSGEGTRHACAGARMRSPMSEPARRTYLFASDFDQTLSFNDSGAILSELLGTAGFEEKIAGLARINLVQQGGELAYLVLHDPEYRRVRREHLVEVGRRVRLKPNIRLLAEALHAGIARRTVLSDDASSVLVPLLEDIVGWSDPARIRSWFEPYGLQIQEWDKVRTDLLTIRESPAASAAAEA